MSYYIRPMCLEDVNQVTEIDREVFPSQWSSPSYRHELQNRLAHYTVVCDQEKIANNPEVNASLDKNKNRPEAKVKQFFRRFWGKEPPPPSKECLIGFVGFWIMADEAHITNIAVREAYRRRGLGEWLLISTIDLALELEARIVTLEVRASNTVAQSLYVKYDFTQLGVRRGYYIDRGYPFNTREDGIVMSTPNIASAEFQTHLQQLKKAHSKRWEITLPQVAR